MTQRRNRAVAPIIAIATIAVSAFAYYYFSSSSTSSRAVDTTTPQSNVTKTPSSKRISILLTKSLLEAGIPINILINRYPNLVLIIAPDLSTLDHPQLTSQVPLEQRYRMIRCESIMGVIHVLKHLRPSLAILPGDAPSKVEKEISAFVGETTTLNGDQQSNEIIQSLLS